MVDKISDQFLLNTASCRFFVPQLYREYLDDDSSCSTVDLDITVNVLDFGEIVPVSC
jgi:hypothetical protein